MFEIKEVNSVEATGNIWGWVAVEGGVAAAAWWLLSAAFAC